MVLSKVLSRRNILQSASSLFIASFAFSADPEFWNNAPPDKWTPEEIEELLSKSPWAKPVSAELKGYAPLSTNAAPSRRRGSIVPSSRAGANTSDAGSAKFPGVVRWASAKPILLALKQQLPDELAGHFVISVSGLPVVSGHGDDSAGVDVYEGLKQQTFLQVKGQAPVQPGIIQPDKKETSTLYFAFLPQLVQLDGDKTVTFETVMDPLKVKVRFEMKQMKFKGDLAV